MNVESDPPRLLDPAGDAPDRVKRLLSGCRDDVGSSEQMQEMESRLTPMLWAPAAVTAPTGTATLTAVKLGALAIVAAAAGGSFWMGTRTDPSTLGAPAPGVRPPIVKTVAPTAARSAAATSPAPVVPVTKAASSAAHGSNTADVPTESDLLTQAQSVLGRDATKALALTEQHRKSYPQGVLTQEREIIAIEALSRLGRTAEVKARATHFQAAYPKSAHQSKLQSLIGSQ